MKKLFSVLTIILCATFLVTASPVTATIITFDDPVDVYDNSAEYAATGVSTVGTMKYRNGNAWLKKNQDHTFNFNEAVFLNSIDINPLDLTELDVTITTTSGFETQTLTFGGSGWLNVEFNTDNVLALTFAQNNIWPYIDNLAFNEEVINSGGNGGDGAPQMANPVPAPILLLGTGLVGLAGFRRRKE